MKLRESEVLENVDKIDELINEKDLLYDTAKRYLSIE